MDSECRDLGRECSELTSKYFVGVLNAPTPYTALGRSLEWLGYNLRQLSNQKGELRNPKATVVLTFDSKQKLYSIAAPSCRDSPTRD
jgi:hypothetical protein